MNIKARVRALSGSYAVQRVATAGLVFGTSILCAKALPPEIYADLVFFFFLAKSLIMGNLGASSGYLVHHYTRQQHDEDQARRFANLYASHLAVLGIIVAVSGIFAGPVYLVSGLGFLLIVPFIVVEPVFRVKRVFIFSLLPDILLSFGTLLATAVYVAVRLSGASPHAILAYVLPSLALFSLPLAWRTLRDFDWRPRRIPRDQWSAYVDFLKAGLPRYSATAILTVLLWLDRVFLEKFYDRAELGVYLLAFQLASGAAILVTAHNMISAVDIGEAISKGQVNRSLLGRVFTQSVVFGSVGLVLMVAASYLLEHYFLTNYHGLFHNTVALCIGVVAFQCAANVTDVAYYKGRHRWLILGLLALVAASLVWNVTLAHHGAGSALWLAALCGGALLLYSVFSLVYCTRLVSRDVSVKSVVS